MGWPDAMRCEHVTSCGYRCDRHRWHRGRHAGEPWSPNIVTERHVSPADNTDHEPGR